jgi:O-antigen ligase
MPVIALIGYFVYSKKFNSIKRRSFPKPGPAEFAMAVFLAITIANVYLFQSNPLPYIILVYDRIFIPMCLYILVRVIEPRQNDLERILPIAMFLIMIESLIGILSQTAPHLVPAEWAFHQGERAVGTFTSAHGYTMSMVFFILLLYHGAMQRKSGIVRTIYLIGVAFGVMGILLSFTRGSWLGAIVVGVGLIILYPKNTLRFAGLLVTFMAILGMTIFSDQVDFALDRIDSEDTALDRLVIWDAGRQMIEKKPLFGWGYGDYSLYAPQFQQRIQNYIAANPHASHNSLITIAAELGIPALLAFLFPFLWWLILSPTVWSKIPKSGFWSQPLLAVLWLVILDIFIETTFTDIRHSTYNQGIWWITLALIANMIYSYKSTNDLKILVRRVKK